MKSLRKYTIGVSKSDTPQASRRALLKPFSAKITYFWLISGSEFQNKGTMAL